MAEKKASNGIWPIIPRISKRQLKDRPPLGQYHLRRLARPRAGDSQGLASGFVNLARDVDVDHRCFGAPPPFDVAAVFEHSADRMSEIGRGLAR